MGFDPRRVSPVNASKWKRRCRGRWKAEFTKYISKGDRERGKERNPGWMDEMEREDYPRRGLTGG
jgi:hypothetical protein